MNPQEESANKKMQFQDHGKAFIHHVRSKEQVACEQIEHSWENIQLQLTRKKNRVIRMRLVQFSAIAACLTLIFSIPFWNSSSHDAAYEVLLSQQTSKPTTITLETAHETIQLLNNSIIELGEGNNFNIAQGIHSIARHNTRSDLKEWHKISIPEGQKATLKLSDGSTVILNEETQALLPHGNQRKVYLQGEAYFDIEKQDGKKFEVLSEALDVEVLGTIFNMKSSIQANKPEAEVALIEGKIIARGANKEFVLQPNEKVSLLGDQIRKESVQANEYTYWINNLYNLEGKRVSEILAFLTKHYSISIECPENLQSITLLGRLDLREDAESTLTILANLLHMNCHTLDENSFEIAP